MYFIPQIIYNYKYVRVVVHEFLLHLEVICIYIHIEMQGFVLTIICNWDILAMVMNISSLE